MKERAIVNEHRPALRVVDLFVYPVKSTRGLAIARSDVEPWGLRDDRRWAVVDPDGHRVTGREQRRLLTVTAVPDAAGGLTLSAPRRPPLHVPVPVAGEAVPIEFSASRTACSPSTAPSSPGRPTAATAPSTVASRQ